MWTQNWCETSGCGNGVGWTPNRKTFLEVTGRSLKKRMAMWEVESIARVFKSKFPVNYRTSSKMRFKFPGNFKPIFVWWNESIVSLWRKRFFSKRSQPLARFSPRRDVYAPKHGIPSFTLAGLGQGDALSDLFVFFCSFCVLLFQTCLCFFVLFVCWARRSALNHSLWKRWFVETSMIGYLAGTVINCPVLQSRCGLCVSFGVWPYVGTAAGVCSAHLNIHLKNIHRPWSFAGLSRKEVIFIVVSIDFVVSIDLACILILVSGWEWISPPTFQQHSWAAPRALVIWFRPLPTDEQPWDSKPILRLFVPVAPRNVTALGWARQVSENM